MVHAVKGIAIDFKPHSVTAYLSAATGSHKLMLVEMIFNLLLPLFPMGSRSVHSQIRLLHLL